MPEERDCVVKLTDAHGVEQAWEQDPLVLAHEGVHGRYTGEDTPRNSFQIKAKKWCPGWESNPHEEKSPEDFKSSASAIPPPGHLAVTHSLYRLKGILLIRAYLILGRLYV